MGLNPANQNKYIMKKVIVVLSASALVLGVFLATNTVAPENNIDISLSSLTSLNKAEAYCSSGEGMKPIYGYRYSICGYKSESEGDLVPFYCFKRTIVGYGDYTNNGSCEDGVNCWASEGSVLDCYAP